MNIGLTAKSWRLIKFEIEEVILLFIVLLNLFDAIELLPPDLDYIKKIISWSALGYLFYKSRPSKIFFGHVKKRLDIALILAYFLMIIKSLISYAQAIIDKASTFLTPFYLFLIKHAAFIETTGLVLGVFLLLIIAIRFTLKVPIRAPSVMSIIHQKGPVPQSFGPFLWRVSSTFVILLAFFVIVFNLVMEWLAIAIDAPLLMIGLAVYIFFIVKHWEKFSAGSFLARFGDFGSNFYKDVIEHFMYKRTIFRALGGMLVLHILTEALHFIWPFVLNLKDSFYFGILNTQLHPSAWSVFLADGATLALSGKILLAIILVGNIFGMLFLLLFPGVMWYLIYKNKPFHPTRSFLAVIFFSLITTILAPVFSLRPLGPLSGLAGVDFQSHSIIANSLLPLDWIVLIAIGVSVLVVFISSKLSVERFLMQTLIHISQLFFTVYIALFSFSVIRSLLAAVGILSLAGHGLLAFIFILLLAINVIFYVFGLFSFLADTESHIKEHVRY